MPTRRGFLAVAGALATAGCSGLTGSTPTPEETAAAEPVFQSRVRSEIPEGGHRTIDFTPETNGSVRIFYEMGVVGDGAVDVMVLEGPELDAYDAGDTVSYHPGLSAFDVSSERRERRVPAQRYGVVFDNTDVATDSTTDVTVEHTVRVTRA
ncbi:hypothetical protein [Halosimplex marinum]|uniref:hypothetical protein n=1 Tax=Halosimplex marinum TaxID=3396620 RepID=UPI003F5588E8